MVSVPTCHICEKRLAVPIKAMVDGLILDVCGDCLKYGREIEVTDVEKIIIHCDLVECSWIESSKGE